MEDNVIYSSKAFSDSDRLNEANITIFKLMRNLPDYADFNENIKMQRQAIDKEKVIKEGIQTLSVLKSKIENELKSTAAEIQQIKAPNRSSSDIQLKLYAQSLIDKAYRDFTLKPNNIHEKLKTALEVGENEYIFEVRDLYQHDKSVSDLDKMKVSNFVNELEQLLGLPELESKKDILAAELIHVRQYLDLLNVAPELFEARLSNEVRVAKRMQEHGSFESSSILLDA